MIDYEKPFLSLYGITPSLDEVLKDMENKEVFYFDRNEESWKILPKYSKLDKNTAYGLNKVNKDQHILNACINAYKEMYDNSDYYIDFSCSEYKLFKAGYDYANKLNNDKKLEE